MTEEKNKHYIKTLSDLLNYGISVVYGKNPLDAAIRKLADALTAKNAAGKLKIIYRAAVFAIANKEIEEAKITMREFSIYIEWL